MKRKILYLLMLLSLLSCGNSGRGGKSASVPVLRYASLDDDAMEQQVCDYVFEAITAPLEEGQAMMEELLWEIEREERMDSSSHVFMRMTELVSKYLYDPNSPLRDEDVYYPFVKGLLQSEFTSPDMHTAYEYEAKMCALNPRGQVAADFRMRTPDGRIFRLHDIESEAVILFFSNPGCNACGTIIQGLEAVPGIEELIENRILTIVSVYIDEDLDAWRKHIGDYPSDWIVACDPDYVIREDLIYNVRAIPSLYLLDAGKRVVLKDAPVERIMNIFANQ